MNRYVALFLVIFTCFAYSQSLAAEDKQPEVLLETTKGDIVIALNPAAAPVTVANFLNYVNTGYYNGTIFHRVIKDFMIQGGGFQPDMSPRPANAPIKNEADNGLKNSAGTVAMARTPEPHSATSQFFINVKDNAFLDHKSKTGQGWGYCVFGVVTKGLETVKSIENSPTGMRDWHQDVPIEPIIIKRASVLTLSGK